MSSFRYDTSGCWLKGNTHVHSTASDGGRSFNELAQMYAAQGYDFLFRTDHWVASDVAADREKAPLVWLDGIELDGLDGSGAYYHVVCLGTFKGLNRSMGLLAALEAARAQNAVTILAHPFWTGNSLNDALRWSFDGVEIYNHVCHWLNGKGDGLVHWNGMLTETPQTLGFAADDAHIRAEHPGWNGGWIVVNARARTPAAIIASIRAGNYYSSCGPLIMDLSFDGETVYVRSSPVQFIRLVGPTWEGSRIGYFDGKLISEAAFQVPKTWRYVYLELEDSQRRRAWTNTLFVDTPQNA